MQKITGFIIFNNKTWKQLILFICAIILSASMVSCGQGNTKRDIPANATRPKQLFKDSIPPAKDYVNDYEDIFSRDQELMLSNLIGDFEKTDSTQIAIISFDTSMIARDSLDAITLKIANEWGVGQKYKNNGITIGICIGYRKIRIQNGLGIEKLLSNTETKKIIDSVFLPSFSDGNYFTGTFQGVSAIMAALRSKR